MKQLVASFNAWAKTLPPPLNTLMVIFGIEVALLAVFFAFALLLVIIWAVMHPILWPHG